MQIPKHNYLAEDSWKNYAACRGVENGVFYPSNGRPSNETLKFCSNCLVQVRCAVDATIGGDDNGIWGGLLISDREKANENFRFRKKLFLKIIRNMKNNNDINDWLEYSREISGIDDTDDRVELIRTEKDLTPEIINKILIIFFIYGIDKNSLDTDTEIVEILENNNIVLDISLLNTVKAMVQQSMEKRQFPDIKKYLPYLGKNFNDEYITELDEPFEY